MFIDITVSNKNSDYIINFSFDEEWNDYQACGIRRK